METVLGWLQAYQSWLANLGMPWLPLAIFGLRGLDQTLATMRMLITSQGRWRMAWILGFFQAMLFLAAISGVLSRLDNLWTLAAFAGGYAIGSVVGIGIDRLLAPGQALLRIISRGHGAAVSYMLQQAGIGVTEIAGHGLEGTVSVLLSSVPRRRLRHIQARLLEVDPKAFVTAENIRVLRGGWNT